MNIISKINIKILYVIFTLFILSMLIFPVFSLANYAEPLIFGKKTLKNASVHIFIHGGYWRALDKSDHSQLANPFVENNILYFSINHDLCPAVTLSEIIQQVNSAIIWIYNNCKNYD